MLYLSSITFSSGIVLAEYFAFYLSLYSCLCSFVSVGLKALNEYMKETMRTKFKLYNFTVEMLVGHNITTTIIITGERVVWNCSQPSKLGICLLGHPIHP